MKNLSSAMRGAIAFVALLAVAGTAVWFLTRPSPLRTAYDACDDKHSMGLITLTDGDKSIAVDGVGRESGRMFDEGAIEKMEGLLCLFDELEISNALRQDITSTTSLMGRQSASEDGLEFRWSYHPNSGIKMTIRKD